jgi:esterase
MKLYYREQGQGRPMIIQHGLFGSSDNWLTISKTFAENFHVYLLDARNHGRSPWSEVHTYEAMSADLLEFIQEHKIENPVIIGHSMGGKMLMRFIADHPEFNAQYVVADISPRYYTRHHDEILAGLNALDLPNLPSRQDADTQLSTYVSGIGERQFLLKNLYKKEDGSFAWRANLDVLTRDIENIGEALGDGAAITRPVLFLRGERSNYIREEDEKLIRERFKNVRIETIYGAGHWIQAEKPVEFAEAVLKFVKETE